MHIDADLVYLSLLLLFSVRSFLTATLPSRPPLFRLWQTVDGSTDRPDASQFLCQVFHVFFPNFLRTWHSLFKTALKKLLGSLASWKQNITKWVVIQCCSATFIPCAKQELQTQKGIGVLFSFQKSVRCLFLSKQMISFYIKKEKNVVKICRNSQNICIQLAVLLCLFTASQVKLFFINP